MTVPSLDRNYFTPRRPLTCPPATAPSMVEFIAALCAADREVATQ